DSMSALSAASHKTSSLYTAGLFVLLGTGSGVVSYVLFTEFYLYGGFLTPAVCFGIVLIAAARTRITSKFELGMLLVLSLVGWTFAHSIAQSIHSALDPYPPDMITDESSRLPSVWYYQYRLAISGFFAGLLWSVFIAMA